MLKKQETVIIVSLVLFIFLFVYNSEISPDLYFVNFNIKDSVSCYHVSENDGLPQLVHFNPPTNSIYFHETSCRGRINSKQACSIESAARSHPKWTIHVLFSGPIHKIAYQDVNLEILRSYKNVKFLRVHLDEYCKDTPVENLYLNGALNRTRWPQRHGRDILKFITLYKWGGIYLDLETLVVNSLENLPRNWALVDGNQVSTSALALFGDYDTGVRFSYAILSTMANTYRGDVLEHNGPILMKRVLDRMCFTSDITEMTPDRCYGFNVLGPDILRTIDSHYDEDIINTKTLIYNFPHHFNNDSKVSPDTFYAKLAKQHCPIVYRTYGNKLGI